jgi:hypothetical protein
MCMKKALMKRNHLPRHQRLGKSQRWLGLLGICLLLWLSACASAPAQSQRSANLGPTPTPDFQLRNTAITTRQTLAAYEQLIAQAQTYGHTVTQDQQQLDQDYQDFASARTAQAYQALTARIQAQMRTLRTAMLPEKTRYDVHRLQKMIGQTNINNDYEYRDAADALLDLQSRLQWAKTTKDYQQIDHQAQILLINLQALLTNLNDKTPHKRAHVTDLQLIAAYHLTGKVIVVSLTEQTLRMYDNGKLVGWMYVVTGQRAAQTPPGLWHVITKGTNGALVSADAHQLRLALSRRRLFPARRDVALLLWAGCEPAAR